ncbi:GNAT family N-acetyltransferase [Psychrobacter sp.]|uniref:GNAT family N-acetyltransferase n=1 Tax=Psychrobacter sp. TaxID=56811 RepID=UPI0025FEDC70|nr:GNAT family N-acetyltransferase [Psychrobacter sp.]
MVSTINSTIYTEQQITKDRIESHDIRLAKPDDLAQVVAIYNQSIAGKASTADLTPVTIADRKIWFDDHLNNPHRPIYIMTNATGSIVAWGSFSDVKSRLAYHISSEISIYVAESGQGLGLGKQMLQWMLSQAPQLGITNILALIFGHNKPSLALFNKFGFEQWGKLPNVCDMQDFRADIIILGLSLDNLNH